ncbi:MAG TPA: AraC family transcriptional regulator [Steroidobacteraceae bacterium]|nr:AraC family transcriptional regulator [Steroidobacteraceae bacterium]
MPVHTHQDAHFIWVTGGEYVSAAGSHPPADRPVLIYNPPGTTHRDHFERGRGSFFAVSLQPQLAVSMLAAASLPAAPVYLRQRAQHALIMRIGRGARGMALQALTGELFGTMQVRPQAESAAPPGWLSRALELLQDRYLEDLSIADVAASVGVHPIHLARTFRRHFRCTPGEFARVRRLERAVALLLQSAQPLADVALGSGFADQSHLSRAFTRAFGLPPGEYRALAGQSSAQRRFQTDKTAPVGLRKLTHWAAAARRGTS